MRTFAPGDVVFHRSLGRGIIVTNWGSWIVCAECGGDLLNRVALCRKCKTWTTRRDVSGKHIYDVRFGAHKHSVWAERLSKKPFRIKDENTTRIILEMSVSRRS